MRFLSALVLMFGVWACAPEKNKTEVEEVPEANKFQDSIIQEIHELKDKRKAEELHIFLQHDEAKYRAEAAFSLSSVGDSLSGLVLSKLFQNEENAVVQQNMALGLFGCSFPIDSVLAEALYARAMSTEIKKTLLRALGRNGQDLGSLIANKALEDGADGEIKLGAIKGFYEQLGVWRTHEPYMSKMAIDFLSDAENDELRIHSAAYLSRLRRLPSIDLTAYKDQIYALLGQEENPLVKMHMATTIALIKDSMKANVIHSELSEEGQDYRVLVSLLQIADEDAFKLIKPVIEGFMSNKNEHLQIAASAYLLRYAKPELKDFYKACHDKTSSWKAGNHLLEAMLKSSNTQELPDALSMVQNQISQNLGPHARAGLYRAFASYCQTSNALIDLLKKEDDETAKTYGMEALLIFIANKGEMEGDELAFVQAAMATDLVNSKDAFRVYTLANYFRVDVFNEVELPDLKPLFQQWELPQYFETRLELEKLQLYREGMEYEKHELHNPYNNPTDWEYVKTLGSKQQMILHTAKGDVTIDLCIENAPGSVSYLLKLAENGFYDGLNFHRVLSNFVAQGGDPDGNGTGSTPNSLRSEFGWEEYGEGAVGIASAGKDTESCQFFITHNHTPHLNGRYTIIGHVSKGMDVVHQLMVGDVINKVEVLK